MFDLFLRQQSCLVVWLTLRLQVLAYPYKNISLFEDCQLFEVNHIGSSRDKNDLSLKSFCKVMIYVEMIFIGHIRLGLICLSVYNLLGFLTKSQI